MKLNCYVCKRKPVFKEEGRVIDGSWKDDAYIPQKNKWVCSWNCYQKLIEKNKKGGRNEKGKI